MVKKTNEEMMEALNEATKKIGDVYYSLSCQKEKKEPAAKKLGGIKNKKSKEISKGKSNSK